MENFWDVTLGEVLTIVVALLALLSATLIGKKQNKINEILLKLQDSVELYILSNPITIRDLTGEQKDKIVPGLYIRNLSQSSIYLSKYLFNGRDYPLYDEVLPSVSQYDSFHYIFLPTDGTTHVSFEIFFLNWKREEWRTKGYADFIDKQWKITYEPCKRVSRE